MKKIHIFAGMKHAILTSLCLLLFCSCRQGSKNDLVLLQEASLHTAQPDSVLNLLGQIACPDRLKGKDRADYALLYTEARNKQNRIGTSDSLIRIALGYYSEEAPSIPLAKSYFLLGRIYQQQGNDTLALKTNLQAFAALPPQTHTDAGELRLGVLISQNRFLSASFVALSGNAALCRRTSRYYGLLHHRIQHGEHLYAAEPI